MSENEDTQRDSQPESQPKQQAVAPAQPQVEKPPTMPAGPSSSMPSQGAGWARASPSQVVRTVAIALLTTAAVVGALFLLWQGRIFVGWLVISLFLAAVLNPAVNWLQRRHRLIKRPLAIVLTYLGVVVVLLFVVGILLPVLVDQIQGLIKFISSVANAPEGPTEYLKGLAQQYRLGWVFERFSDQLDTIRSQLGKAASNFLLSTGNIIVSAAVFVAALVSVLTMTFFLLLGGERYLNAGVGLFPEAHRPLVRRLLKH